MADWLSVVMVPGCTTELRILFSDRSPIIRHHIDPQRLAADAARLSGGARGVYWSMNPLPAPWSGAPANDSDILARRWLLVDCDPARPAGVSSTDAERRAAWSVALGVRESLSAAGWPDPLLAGSGNGYHLLYRIDLPAEDDGVVSRCLRSISRRHSTPQVEIDTRVGNASRICKMYGTLAAKGPPTTERPHRMSKMITIPQSIDTVRDHLIRDSVTTP